MNTIRYVNIGIWATFAIACLIMTIVDFSWFTLLMTIVCSGMSIMSFLEYRWGRDITWGPPEDKEDWRS